MQIDEKALARSSLLFSSMPRQEAETILSKARVIEFDRGQTVFLQGEMAKAVYIVMDGWVKLYRIAPSGTEAIHLAFDPVGQAFLQGVQFLG